MDNWIEFLVPMVTQCPQDVGILDCFSRRSASMTRPSISPLIQRSVSMLPQLNQLITYRWVIVHAAHGMLKEENKYFGVVLFKLFFFYKFSRTKPPPLSADHYTKKENKKKNNLNTHMGRCNCAEQS